MCYGNLELFTPTCVTFCHSREKTVVENFAIKYEILIDFKCILIKESFKKGLDPPLCQIAILAWLPSFHCKVCLF